MRKRDRTVSAQIHECYQNIGKLTQGKSRAKRDAFFFYGGLMIAIELSKKYRITSIRTEDGKGVSLR